VIERRVLEPLKASPDLIETVETMIRNGMKRASAAESLHVHPSTVDYRMRRAQELTGLDLSSPKDLALAVLAMEHRALGH
jgi:DNA-binding PucR family transcriptional regulator